MIVLEYKTNVQSPFQSDDQQTHIDSHHPHGNSGAWRTCLLEILLITDSHRSFTLVISHDSHDLNSVRRSDMFANINVQAATSHYLPQLRSRGFVFRIFSSSYVSCNVTSLCVNIADK